MLKSSRINKIKILGLIVFVVVGVLFVVNSTKLLQKPSDTFVVEKGSISYEEIATRIYNS